MTDIPLIRLTGSPYERGMQHGRHFAARIAARLNGPRNDHGPEQYEAARARAARCGPNLLAMAPDIHSELQGIAHGSGTALEDIYLGVGFEFFDHWPQTGCSSLAISDESGALVAQNWDAPVEACDDLVAFLHCSAAGMPETLMIASMGGLGWVGLNRHGLALVNNDLMLDTVVEGLPSQVVRRMALGQPDVGSAGALMQSLEHMGGRSYLFGDGSGAIGGIEVSPKAGAVVLPPANPLLHTNNALLAETRVVEDEAALQAVYPSSRRRLAILGKRARSDRNDISAIKSILSDRTGAPDAVSKTFSRTEPTETAFSVIFDCGAREAHVCTGPPSLGHYRTIALNS